MQSTIPIPILVLAALMLLVVSSASAAGITRAVEQGADQNWSIHLSYTGGPILGVTEIIPAGAVMTSCSLPPDQYRSSGDHLYFAVLGEPSFSYTLKAEGPVNIQGTWTDFSDGSSGQVLPPVPGQVTGNATGTPVSTGSLPVPQATRAGDFPAMLAAIGAGMAVMVYFSRRNDP
jgi:hypothetical protein